jgi:predicted amidohydrolase
VVGVNRVGRGGGLEYSGDSRIIDPWGEVLAAAAGGETMIVADVDAAVVREAREKFPVLADRR